MNHADKPSILTDGELAYSPWITADRLKRDGALVVWTEGRGGGTTLATEKLITGRAVQERRIAFPRGKAGSYAIQGLGAVFVSALRGSYSGVMGLPLFETAGLIDAAGVPRWQASGTDGDA